PLSNHFGSIKLIFCPRRHDADKTRHYGGNNQSSHSSLLAVWLWIRTENEPVATGPRPCVVEKSDCYCGSAKVFGSTLSRTLNSEMSCSNIFSPSRLASILVAFLMPLKSL